ncbi:MAG: hypothetical protein QM541_01425 [Flavobacterium sp.]|nr:hypothetical protein [Flavobacterium sp.]
MREIKLLLISFLLLVSSKLLAQQYGDIVVGGSFDKFYPVAFQDGAWHFNKMTELTIGRVEVHENSTWRGSTLGKFSFHCNLGGHGSENIEATIFFHVNPFIAGWKDVSFYDGARIIIWLRGGNTTYHYNSNYAVNPTVYDTDAGYNEPSSWNNPPIIVNRPPKTTVDSYVNSHGYNFTGNTTLTTNPINITSVWSSTTDKSNNISEIANDVDFYKRLMIAGNTSSGGVRQVGIYDRLTIGNVNFEQALNVAGGAYLTGNVGIGTKNAQNYKLAVEGTIGARKVKVTLENNWADYVFAPSYKLRPLQDLETYIKQHQHLPDVPSASEVAANGIDLGDNQAVLLKKIEELTLYVIEQQKQMKLMSKRINELEIKNK